MDIETQCEVIQYPIKEKTFKKKKTNKKWTDFMLWHLDQYWKVKQGF